MDNVRAGVAEPQEDEFALVADGLSFMLGLVIFPRSHRRYQKFLTLAGAASEELELWKSALMRFLQKLTFKHQRPLILKSPAHTGRIEVLLDMFPDAKFVHIHRDPYAVFQSTMHTWRAVKGFWGLQNGDVEETRVLEDYVWIYDAYFAHRHRLAKRNFCEVRFDDLERDPIGQIRNIYRTLELPDFDVMEPALRHYVGSLAGYSRNHFPAMPAATQQRVAHAWGRSFDTWGYSR